MYEYTFKACPILACGYLFIVFVCKARYHSASRWSDNDGPDKSTNENSKNTRNLMNLIKLDSTTLVDDRRLLSLEKDYYQLSTI